ncbi:four helix bundle protein [Candidatus Gracilibacteria bacterium]|nr:four helix bundle protein [Candidatus Gracilibacteria bacterium]
MKKENKLPYIQKAIQILDTVKIMLHVAHNIKAFETKQYITLSEKLHEIGKMLGGWHNQVEKQLELQKGKKNT